jgi:hypothetical protein
MLEYLHITADTLNTSLRSALRASEKILDIGNSRHERRVHESQYH